MAANSPVGANRIATLLRSELLSVEEVIGHTRSAGLPRTGYSERFHVILPLSGSFLYREDARSFFGDANHFLLVPAQREYRVTHPLEGDRSLVLFPRWELLGRVGELSTLAIEDTEVRVAGPDLRLASFSFVRRATEGADSFELDELIVDLCRKIIDSERVKGFLCSPVSRAHLSRAKEYLHAHFRDQIGLADVAHAVGVSPIYLTQLFKRVLGIPLYQYLMSLRLGEALNQIAETDDITALAFDLGFSSHSHFTAAFRSRFGVSPSAIRRLHKPSAANHVVASMSFPPGEPRTVRAPVTSTDIHSSPSGGSPRVSC